MKRPVALAALAALLLLGGDCSRREAPPPPRCEAADAGTPIEPLLLAFLSRARAAHHLADAREGAGDLSAAIAPLAGLVLGPFPPHPGSAGNAAEVSEVLADTRARLGDLRSRQGAFEPALADVRAGLEAVPSPNYFRGHLLETEGLIEERHAKALESSDPAAAATIRQRALTLLEQAMAVQSGVLEAGARAPTSTPNPPALATPPPAP
jgi:hypothetical protein